ncbi:MAG: DUF2061 domain-containing protein [Bacteroidales bacterium]|jgi:uncharacterized membrane protein|nr:DUF2061 domain-containing protein [Bacteroidales bacterium]
MLDVLINKDPDPKSVKGVYRFSDRADKPIKSVMKAISWRIVGTVDTMLISYLITGKVALAITIGSVEVLTKTILYYFHERLWAHIHRIRFNLLNKRNGVRIKARSAGFTTQA